MHQYQCPSCGADVKLQSAASVLAVCDYCKSTLIRRDLDVENIGRMAELQSDGSPIQLRVEGNYRNLHFAIVGRIQLRFKQGLWNEWYLLFDDQQAGWLGEAQGTYAISFSALVPETLPAFDQLKIGGCLPLQGKSYEVVNIESALCIGGEGELPFLVGAGYAAPVADLQGPGKAFATLDYSEESPLVFLGEYLEFDEFHFSGLREFDGW